MLEIERIQRQLSELEEWSARLAGEISLLNAVQIALEEGHATTKGLTPGLFALLGHFLQLQVQLDRELEAAKALLD